jgi:hypothetical protein
MESNSSKKLSGAFLILVGAALFSFGYYMGLPKSSMDNKNIAHEAYTQKQGGESQSKKSNSIPKSFERDRDVPLIDSQEEENDRSFVSKKSLEEILLSAQSETNPIKRSAAFARALETLNPDNISQALKAFESLPMGFENMQEYKMLLYTWSQFDPLAAIDYCKSRASGIGAGFAASGVLEGWATRDPYSAKAWVEDPENAGMAKLYNFGLVKGWATRDLEGATAYVMNLKGGDEVAKLVGILTDQHNREGGFGRASSWAEELPDPKLKEGAFMNLSRSFARDRPEEVAEWLETHANEKYSAKAFENLGKKWSETDPESSISYFSNLPDGKSQEVGIKSSISNWAKQDPLAAGEWLNERDSGPKLDSALAAYASTVSLKDGGAAMEWAISISDPKLQKSTIKKVGQEWYRQDKDSVEAWLPQSGLPESEQKSIRNPPKKSWWQSMHEK